MKIDKKLIRHVAELARLDLTEEEVARFQPQLKDIIETFSQLDKVDTSDIVETVQPVEKSDSLRDDKVGPCLTQKEALSQSEHTKDGYFKGPKAV